MHHSQLTSSSICLQTFQRRGYKKNLSDADTTLLCCHGRRIRHQFGFSLFMGPIMASVAAEGEDLLAVFSLLHVVMPVLWLRIIAVMNSRVQLWIFRRVSHAEQASKMCKCSGTKLRHLKLHIYIYISLTSYTCMTMWRTTMLLNITLTWREQYIVLHCYWVYSGTPL